MSAYFTDEIVPRLTDRFDIEIFYDGFGQYRDLRTAHFLAAFRRHKERPFDCFVYQLEDRRAAYFTRMHLGLIPGIVILHDLLLSDDGPEPILNSPWEEVVKKFASNERPWSARGREYTRAGPLALRESGMAMLPLFTCPRMHAEYRRSVELRLAHPALSSAYLPFPASQFPLRGHLGGDLRIGFSGSPRIEHRTHKLLQALQGVARTKLLWLVEAEEKPAAEELLREFELPDAELIVGRSPAKWREILPQIDVAVHTLFSVFGQAGPYLNLSMMAGVPCIATQFSGIDLLPDSVLFKIQAGETEATEIRLVLEQIAAGDAFELGKAGQRYAQEFFDPKVIALELADTIVKASPALDAALKRWEEMEKLARAELLREVSALRPGTSAWQATLDEKFTELGWR